MFSCQKVPNRVFVTRNSISNIVYKKKTSGFNGLKSDFYSTADWESFNEYVKENDGRNIFSAMPVDFFQYNSDLFL